jgi:hypothetical protein
MDLAYNWIRSLLDAGCAAGMQRGFFPRNVRMHPKVGDALNVQNQSKIGRSANR